MNPLDDLISSSSRVPGVTPDGLGKGRAALDAAIAAGARRESPARRKAAARWFSFSGRELRGKTVIGVAGVAAVAAAVTVLALPSSSPRTAGKPLGDSSARPTVQATPAPRAYVPPHAQTTAGPVNYTFTTAGTDVTAAYVYAQAVKGAAATQASPESNVPLAGGWPEADYWHVLEQDTSSACPGVVNTSNSWLAKSGAEVAQNKLVGTTASGSISSCGSGYSPKPFPVVGGPSGPMIGGRIYTWAQFAALPTDPAKLWPILQADSKVGVASHKGEPEQDWLWQTIGMVLTSDPVSPAMRMALFDLSEKIPGVTVSGTYTDSLGRTGIALTQGTYTEVIDTSNGEILASLTGAPPIPPGCVRVSLIGTPGASCAVGGASTTVYISAGPTNSAPDSADLNSGNPQPSQPSQVHPAPAATHGIKLLPEISPAPR